MADNIFSTDLPKLGFGFMRMPNLEDGSKNEDMAREMVDIFMQNGFTYFDTAAIYKDSEVLMNKVLVSRYPRDSFQIATKLPMRDVKTLEEGKQAFETSLERLGVDYVDVYLLHALTGELNRKAEEMGAWDYLKELKASGRAKHIGFSFHDTGDVLDEILTKHPEAEMVQTQVNYIDWDDAKGVDSKGCCEAAAKHGKPVIVMEPVKGGFLVAKDEKIMEKFEAAAPGKSSASWALRFAASQKGIVKVLSGMSDVAQVLDNVDTFKNFKPISEDEQKVIDEVVKELRAFPQYPCTSCRYCVANCPIGIDIPLVIKNLNYQLRYNPENPGETYRMFAKPGKHASDCIECHTCETHCPQKIQIAELMKEAAEKFDNI